jgi:hypothetical protein
MSEEIKRSGVELLLSITDQDVQILGLRELTWGLVIATNKGNFLYKDENITAIEPTADYIASVK